VSIETIRRKKGPVYKVWYRDEAGKGRSRTFTLQRDARAFEADVRLRKRRGHLDDIEAGRVTFEQFAELWWRNQADGLAAKTRETYRWLLDRYLLPELGALALFRIRPQRVEEVASRWAGSSVGPETRRKALALLQTILQRAVVHGAVPTNPVSFVKKPSQKRRRLVRPIHPQQVEAMRKWLVERGRAADATLLSVLAYAGLRPGEALALTWADIGDGVIFVSKAASLGEQRPTKTFESRVVAAVGPLEDDLRWHREDAGETAAEELIFPAASGKLWNENAYRNWRRRWFKPAAEAAGLVDARPYDLRHSYASLRLAEGWNPVEVAEQLGHAPTMTLDTYGHVISELRVRGRQPVSMERLINQAKFEPDEEPELTVQDLYF
jgi:integrase